MRKALPVLLPAAAAAMSVLPAGARKHAQAAPPPDTGKVVGYTAWDDDYLYVCAAVNKATVSAKVSAGFTDPSGDDGVVIGVQEDDDKLAAKRTSGTVTVAVSAAGGFQLYSGVNSVPLFNGVDDLNARLAAINKNGGTFEQQEAQRVELFAKVVKAAVTPHGVQQPDGTFAPGYTAEVAIPWADLGGRPAPGRKMGFEVAALSTGMPAQAIQSLAPGVRAVGDLSVPSAWTNILFSNSPGAAEPNTLVCPRVFTNRPIIDGVLTPGEWNGLSVYSFGGTASATTDTAALARTIAARTRATIALKPAPAPLPAPAAREPVAAPAHTAQPLGRLVIARYDYDYQADTRKAAAAERTVNADGGSALGLHPFDGTGPWFTYDRVDWHRKQLQDAARAGVDAIAPTYRGAPRDRQQYADKGLTQLATALVHLDAAGEDYPLVAMNLDCTGLADVFGAQPDLRSPAVQHAMWNMVRGFFHRIPPKYRLQVPLGPSNGNALACVLILSGHSTFLDMDGTFAPYLRSRFAAEFGCDLLVTGSDGFKHSGALDGYITTPTDKGEAANSDGWVHIATVLAGSDPRYRVVATDRANPLLRREGATYRAAWQGALDAHPDWVWLPDWDDYAAGTAIAPTAENGYELADATRVFTHLFAAGGPAARVLATSFPATMAPGGQWLAGVRVQNLGTEPWLTDARGHSPYVVVCQWLRADGSVVKESVSPLGVSVLPQHAVNIGVTVQTAGLAAGTYALRTGVALETRRAQGTDWVGGVAGTFAQAVEIDDGGAGSWAATLLATDMPSVMETGSAYNVHATLRNDGSVPWPAGSRVSVRIGRTSFDGSEPTRAVESADASTVLSEAVAPGGIAEARVLLPLEEADGKPLTAWSQDQLWTYTAHWEVESGGSGAVAPGTPIDIVPFDFGVRFTADATPPQLPGEHRLPVRLGIRNDSPETWKKDSVRIGYHWYYLDGTEFIWEDETTGLPVDLAPGQSASDVLAWVTAPPLDGTYYLVWDVKVGDTWASTVDGGRPFDELVKPIQVVHGRLTCVDLSKAYNVDGVAGDAGGAGGGFDGSGNAFPGAFMPPFATSDIAPMGMWLPGAITGPDSIRRLGFRFGTHEKGDQNFIACNGQRVDFGATSGPCKILHILAASTGAEDLTSLRMVFQEPSSTSEDLVTFQVSRWDRPPDHGEDVGWLCYGHITKQGPQPGAVALFHYAINLRYSRKLIALVLPKNPSIRIAAISLEN